MYKTEWFFPCGGVQPQEGHEIFMFIQHSLGFKRLGSNSAWILFLFPRLAACSGELLYSTESSLLFPLIWGAWGHGHTGQPGTWVFLSWREHVWSASSGSRHGTEFNASCAFPSATPRTQTPVNLHPDTFSLFPGHVTTRCQATQYSVLPTTLMATALSDWQGAATHMIL